VNRLDQAIHRLALAQQGLITAADATRLGITASGIRHRTTHGHWERVAVGIWRLTTQPVTWVQPLYAAHLALGPHCYISHHTAAALHGFDGFTATGPHTGPPDVLVPWHLRGRRGPWTLHTMGPNQPLPVPNLEYTTHRPTGLLVTTPARTVLDLSGLGLSDDLLGDALDSAWRMGQVSRQFMERLMNRRPGTKYAGRQQLLRLLNDAGGTNRLERAMLAWLRAEGLPRPETQRALNSQGRTIARLDFRFTDVRVSLEVSGARGHSSLRARRRHAAMVHAAQHEGEFLVELMPDEVFERRPAALQAVLTARQDAFQRDMFRPGFTHRPGEAFR